MDSNQNLTEKDNLALLQTSTVSIAASLLSNNFEEFDGYVNALTCVSALNGTQISKFRRVNENMLKTVIHLLVQDVFLSFASADKISQHEIAKITAKILSSYWWLKLEELIYVFNKGKQLHYGKVYGMPAEANFLSWINQYDMFERDAQCIKNAKDEKDKGKVIDKLADAELQKLYSQTTQYKNIGDEELRTSERFKDERVKDEVKEEQFKAMREQYFRNRNSNDPTTHP